MAAALWLLARRRALITIPITKAETEMSIKPAAAHLALLRATGIGAIGALITRCSTWANMAHAITQQIRVMILIVLTAL